MLLFMLATGGLIVLVMNWPAMIFGTCIWLVCVYGPHKMTKADPNVSKVYVWQLRYGNYYRSFPRPHRAAKSPRIY